MPSHLVRQVFNEMLPYLNDHAVFVSATKGLETVSLLRSSEIIQEVVSTRFSPRIVAMSGPTFAREVAQANPTALVVSSNDPAAAECIQAKFSSPTFRLYTSSDPTGVEIGGSIKNVVAIGAGVVHGVVT